MIEMKVVHSREQGCWLHPALYEIGKAIGYCRNMSPCSTRKYLERELWCDPCIASKALGELASLLGHLKDNNTCVCEACLMFKDFIENGAENDRKHGIH